MSLEDPIDQWCIPADTVAYIICINCGYKDQSYQIFRETKPRHLCVQYLVPRWASALKWRVYKCSSTGRPTVSLNHHWWFAQPRGGPTPPPPQIAYLKEKCWRTLLSLIVILLHSQQFIQLSGLPIVCHKLVYWLYCRKLPWPKYCSDEFWMPVILGLFW